MSEIAIRCTGLRKRFTELPVVHDVSFTLPEGQILALLGPSGCGKTTLLRLLAGFEHLDAGHIDIGGVSVADDYFHMPTEKRRVGMVFQDYAIFPHLSVSDNVGFGLRRGKHKAERIETMLDLVGLGGLGDNMPHELSGGQQQRVALARALAPEPAVLLLDEPFSNLDASLRLKVRQEIRALLKLNRITAIFVTHDQEEALYIGDVVAVMHDGRLEQIGSPETIFHTPQTRFVAHFMGNSDFVSGVVVPGGVRTVMGTLAQPVDLADGTPVEVAIRPNDVTISADSSASSLVLHRQFIGMDNLYHIRLPDGTLIHSREPHTTILAPLTPVRVTFTTDHHIPVFHENDAV